MTIKQNHGLRFYIKAVYVLAIAIPQKSFGLVWDKDY